MKQPHITVRAPSPPPYASRLRAASIRLPLALVALCLPSSPVSAGEYGLTVAFSEKEGCRYAVTQTLNTCSPNAVFADLRGHFVAGTPFEIKAVEIAVNTGRIWFRNASDIGPFSDAVVAVCTAENPHDFPVLLRFLRFLPYATLRSRILHARGNAFDAPTAARLSAALKALPVQPRAERHR